MDFAVLHNRKSIAFSICARFWPSGTACRPLQRCRVKHADSAACAAGKKPAHQLLLQPGKTATWQSLSTKTLQNTQPGAHRSARTDDGIEDLSGIKTGARRATGGRST